MEASPFNGQHQETAHPLYENLESALANLSVESEYDVPELRVMGPPVPPRRNTLRASTPNGSLSSGSLRESGSSGGGGIPDIPVLATPVK